MRRWDMKFIKLLILILLLNSILNYAQTQSALVQSADSNHVLVDKLEFRYIVNVFNEYNSLREINKQQVLKNGILERIITDKDKLILLKEEESQLLKQTIEDISPAWWDKFLIGFTSAVVMIVSLLVAVN